MCGRLAHAHDHDARANPRAPAHLLGPLLSMGSREQTCQYSLAAVPPEVLDLNQQIPLPTQRVMPTRQRDQPPRAPWLPVAPSREIAQAISGVPRPTSCARRHLLHRSRLKAAGRHVWARPEVTPW